MLFIINRLLIRTSGEQADIGTITSTDEVFFPWRDIYPEKYRTFTPPLGKARPQETLIPGVLTSLFHKKFLVHRGFM
jgi:type I restriction enzyme R subunit